MVARAIVESGWIGDPMNMSFNVDLRTDFSAWPWLVESPHLDLMYHSIHYLDTIRSILGDPGRVFATAARMPNQVPAGETRTICTLIFPGEVRAVLHVNHENVAGDLRAEFRIDGTEGSIRGAHELFDGAPGKLGVLDAYSRTLHPDGWLRYPLTRGWFPDALPGQWPTSCRVLAPVRSPRPLPRTT